MTTLDRYVIGLIIILLAASPVWFVALVNGLRKGNT
jgi:hypothetical protein